MSERALTNRSILGLCDQSRTCLSPRPPSATTTFSLGRSALQTMSRKMTRERDTQCDVNKATAETNFLPLLTSCESCNGTTRLCNLSQSDRTAASHRGVTARNSRRSHSTRCRRRRIFDTSDSNSYSCWKIVAWVIVANRFHSSAA